MLICRVHGSYRTYETVCRLHEAWKVWKQAMQMEYSTEGNNRLSGDDADRTFGIIERENPLKAFQDPQVRLLSKKIFED